jgi:ABC-type branched-subunit amino acid transport system substrate-binding protein
VTAGLEAYIDYANENELVPGYELALTIGDDQYDPALTPGVISDQLDAGAHVFTAMIGSPNNLAVRDTLNEECVPQLLALSGLPDWGEPAEYPWTTGGLLPYSVESMAYAEHITQDFPDGATVALFYTNNDFGQVYRESFNEVAGEFNLEIVDEQTIEAPETAPPAGQLSSIAGNAPDVIMAAPLGAQCPTFLNELANQKAANAGWEPRVYLTNTCSSPLILAVAGENADGIFTSQNQDLVDVTAPANAELPGVVLYLAEMEARGLSDTVPTSAAGWNAGETTVEILRQAAESPEGLTQASIINTARNFEFTTSLTQEGALLRTSGEEDPFLVEDVQIRQYDVATTTFEDVGELITSFRSSG